MPNGTRYIQNGARPGNPLRRCNQRRNHFRRVKPLRVRPVHFRVHQEVMFEVKVPNADFVQSERAVVARQLIEAQSVDQGADRA